MNNRLRRIIAALLALFALPLLAAPASAEVAVHFHSFNGSVLWGRYPHTFVIFDGELADGTTVNENFGFSARSSSAAIKGGPTEHMLLAEKPKTIAKTNRHFTIKVSDATYRKLRAEVIAWRDHPGKFYDLNSNNCIHFVARLATMLDVKADVPKRFLKKPRAWLNWVGEQNPQLQAKSFN